MRLAVLCCSEFQLKGPGSIVLQPSLVGKSVLSQYSVESKEARPCRLRSFTNLTVEDAKDYSAVKKTTVLRETPQHERRAKL